MNQALHRAPTFTDVQAAAWRIAPYAHITPVLTSRTLDALTGAQLFLKAEQFQRAGAFKFRGACNAIASMDTEAFHGVLAYSSGNHAQAVALAARLHGTKATIVMPQDAPAAKVAATRGYGAQIVFYDRYNESREQIASHLAETHGYALIPPFDHPWIIAGQGTCALELFDEAGLLDVLIVGLGGGGLLAGSCLTANAVRPECKLYGVEPEAGNDGQRSLRSGRIVSIDPPRSIADGAIVTQVGHHTFPIIQRSVEDILTVTDEELVQAMRFLAERMKLVVEPTACLGLAAILSGKLDVRGKRVGLILSGGNVDLGVLARLLGA
ncbi:threonine dehydratase [Pseudoxanthomonas sp. GM95]|uniref:threo-3-hydroxy-L-aspartate ammonia-lyase n=1 Tax=Pseudoxanthomonas sp. GM95 TaxID=1881043 RepID=UPI0008D7279F|nr:threo-3-hydroxy-L-aspartate ammonia-lyase [Pseudoxanthomonas sp. GM95]SEL11555.1 threonine dehydratase [Pseudoxanthomonas sp. GM95]